MKKYLGLHKLCNIEKYRASINCTNSTLPAKTSHLDSQLKSSCSFLRHMTSNHITKPRFPSSLHRIKLASVLDDVSRCPHLKGATYLGTCATPPLERRVPIRQSASELCPRE